MIFLLILCILWQGSGYMGELPSINDYFEKDKIPAESESGFLDIYKNPSVIQAPPDVKKLKKELAPTTLTDEQIKILRPVKRPEYYDDLLSIKPVLQKLKTSAKSTQIQDFGACVNVQKFYFDDFLNKYKNSPFAKQDIYAGIKDINYYSQVVFNQWRESEDNIKYVSYSSFNGAYQPSVIRGKLIVLDKKLDNIIKLVESAE